MTGVWGLAALWLGLALVASLLSIWFRISTALSEIVVGTIAQLIIGAAVGAAVLGTDESWVKFLAGLGAIVLTFLAGAELDPQVFRLKWKEAASVGLASFVFPFLGCTAAAAWLGVDAELDCRRCNVHHVGCRRLCRDLIPRNMARPSWPPVSSPISGPWSRSGLSSLRSRSRHWFSLAPALWSSSCFGSSRTTQCRLDLSSSGLGLVGRRPDRRSQTSPFRGVAQLSRFDDFKSQASHGLFRCCFGPDSRKSSEARLAGLMVPRAEIKKVSVWSAREGITDSALRRLRSVIDPNWALSLIGF